LDKRGCRHRKTFAWKCRERVSRRLRHELRAGPRPHREEGAAANRRGDQDQLSPHADGDEARGRGPGISQRLPRSRLVRRCAQGHFSPTGPAYGTSRAGQGKRILLEFVSANPTGPLVIVNARAAAVGDALARILRAQGHGVECQFYVNDAGNQLQALARSVDVRLRQLWARRPSCPRIPIRANTSWIWWRSGSPPTPRPCARWPRCRKPSGFERLGRMAVSGHRQRPAGRPRGLRHAVRHVGATSRPTCGPGLGRSAPSRSSRPPATPTSRMAPSGSARRTFGDDKDPRPAQSRTVELTYSRWTSPSTTTANSDARLGHRFPRPRSHGHIQRMKAAMEALGHPGERFDRAHRAARDAPRDDSGAHVQAPRCRE